MVSFRRICTRSEDSESLLLDDPRSSARLSLPGRFQVRISVLLFASVAGIAAVACGSGPTGTKPPAQPTSSPVEPTVTPTSVAPPTSTPGPRNVIVAGPQESQPLQGRQAVDGSCSEARFVFPYSLTVDSFGNIYVADGNRTRPPTSTLRRITPDCVVTTIQGVHPIGPVTADTSGNVFVIAEVRGNNQILRIAPDAKTTRIVGLECRNYRESTGGCEDGLVGTPAENPLLALSVTADDRLFYVGQGSVNNEGSNVLVQADISGKLSVMFTVQSGFADGPAATAQFNSIAASLPDGSGGLLLADLGNHSIRRLKATGDVETIVPSPHGPVARVGSADGTLATASFNRPTCLARDVAGNLYVTDAELLRRIGSDGSVSTVPLLRETTGGAIALSSKASCVALDRDGNPVIADANAGRILRVSTH